jgi:hypothetical protein
MACSTSYGINGLSVTQQIPCPLMQHEGKLLYTEQAVLDGVCRTEL